MVAEPAIVQTMEVRLMHAAVTVSWRAGRISLQVSYPKRNCLETGGQTAMSRLERTPVNMCIGTWKVTRLWTIGMS